MGHQCSKSMGANEVSDPAGSRTSKSKGDSAKSNRKPGSKKHVGKKATTSKMDRYEIVKQLGVGGFGVVHLVRENATSEEWAAKCMQTAEGAAGHGDRMTKADIENECEILKMLDHPSICKLHEHFEVNGGSEVVMVMELLSGGDLLESVINNGTYCEADAREIFSRVLDGVAHIHQRGVAHRDLKVENLMMKRAGDLSSVKIIDLGMAVKVKADHEKDKHGERKQQADDELIRGTPEYMSFVAGPAARDYLVDVWALGCLLYILLGGYSPYAENDPKMTVNRIINGRYYPFSTDAVWESVSDEAKDVIAQCFKVERGERITVQGLREHPWLSMEQMGLRHADLTHTRSKLQKNFKGKFKKAGNTIRAALRLQRLMKPTAVSTAAHDPRLKTDSDDGEGGTRDGDGDRGGVVNEEPSSASAASGDARFDVVNSIGEGEEEREEKEEGGESTRERRGSAEKHASSTTNESLVPEE